MDTVDKLPQIPDIMDSMGWAVAARLMRKWFAGVANDKKDSVPPDISTVTLNWLLQVDRAAKTYDQLLFEKIWANKAASKQIQNLLAKNKFPRPSTWRIGDLSQPIKTVHETSVNFRRYVSSVTDPLDDVFGALGTFSYHVAIEGTCLEIVGMQKQPISVDRVGIYVRDKYDFNDDHWYSQPLGFWNFDTGKVGISPAPGFEYVANQTFRDYRRRYNKGCDYWVYSDIKIVRCWPPDVLE